MSSPPGRFADEACLSTIYGPSHKLGKPTTAARRAIAPPLHYTRDPDDQRKRSPYKNIYAMYVGKFVRVWYRLHIGDYPAAQPVYENHGWQ